MNKPAACAGTFSDFKIIKTRSVCQIVVEAPLEQADEALACLGGIPQPGAERPVAVALLAAEPKPEGSAMRRLTAKEAYASKDDMQKAVTRAALLCKDADFRQFLRAPDEESAAAIMCTRLNIGSRRVIGESEHTFHDFLALESQFRVWEQMRGFSPAITGRQ